MNIAMRAAFFSDQSIIMVERPIPAPGPGDALVKTLMAGICNTDIELFKGYYGFSGIPGHEFVGLVERCPDAPQWEGKRICADINAGCGQCPRCLGGDMRHCSTRRTLGIVGLDGAFAEYLSVPAACLREVDEAIGDSEAVFAEPLAAALEIARQIHIPGDSKLLVLGDGKLGLLIALALRLTCPGLILAGKHKEKLALAEAQGVRTIHIASPDDLVGLILDAHGRFDLVVEATGSPDGLGYAMALVRPEGSIVAKTTSHQPSALDLAKLVVDEITLTGSRCGDLGLALEYLKTGLIDVRPLIDSTHSFARFPQAFDRARTLGALKVLIEF